jgi:PleD family two-component response regulator
VSIGAVSRVPAKGQGPDLLLAAADTALYAAKHRGRDTVVLHADMPLAAAG